MITLQHKTTLFLWLALAAQIAVWSLSYNNRASWANVPPAPASTWQSAVPALGDTELAYRAYGIMLQNMGDEGGMSRAFDEYNYDHLGGWFRALDRLNDVSNYVPILAAYYYSGTTRAGNFDPVIDFLADVGTRPSQPGGAKKWRWLMQAVYLARFKQNDLDKALELAQKLADLNDPDMPVWVKQMPAIILGAKGERETAREMMIQVLDSSKNSLHPAEVRFLVDYVCEQLMTPQEAALLDICQNIRPN
jgi:tetratricopeptide (TPR) repeat protein